MNEKQIFIIHCHVLAVNDVYFVNARE